MVNIPNLSVEVLERIIGMAAESVDEFSTIEEAKAYRNLSSIKACALVCRSFSPNVQKSYLCLCDSKHDPLHFSQLR